MKAKDCFELVLDPFNFSLNSRSIIKKLYEMMGSIATDYDPELCSINSVIVKLLSEISDGLRYDNVTCNLDIKWEELFKAYNLRIGEYYESLSEKLIEYIKVISDFTKAKLLCPVNFSGFMSIEEYCDIYQIASYMDMKLLFIDAWESENISCDTTIIIDKDRCMIIK